MLVHYLSFPIFLPLSTCPLFSLLHSLLFASISFQVCVCVCVCVCLIFIWLHWVLVAASRIFDLCYSMWTLSCGMWDLVLWPGIELGPPTLGMYGVFATHWTTREAPPFRFDFESLLAWMIHPSCRGIWSQEIPPTTVHVSSPPTMSLGTDAWTLQCLERGPAYSSSRHLFS